MKSLNQLFCFVSVNFVDVYLEWIIERHLEANWLLYDTAVIISRYPKDGGYYGFIFIFPLSASRRDMT